MEDNKNKLKKKFSIGYTLGMPQSSYISILDEYHEYIESIYFSPPGGDNFHTRLSVVKEFLDPKAESYLYGTLNYAKDLGIKIEFAANTHGVSEEQIINAVENVKRNLDVDYVVTLGRHYNLMKSLYGDKVFIYSYNNGVRTKEDIDAIPAGFDELVLGNSNLRKLDMIEYGKSKYRLRYLINNGCSFNCMWCLNSHSCASIFFSNLSKRNINELYAEQSIFPWEFHKYILDKVDIVKISSRTSTYSILHNTITSYINNITEDYIRYDPANYYLWCRLGHFAKFYNKLDYNAICNIKEAMWDETLTKGGF